MSKNWLDKLALVLVIVGALNWGLVSLNWNLVEWLLGVGTAATVVYGLVGLASVYMIVRVKKFLM